MIISILYKLLIVFSYCIHECLHLTKECTPYVECLMMTHDWDVPLQLELRPWCVISVELHSLLKTLWRPTDRHTQVLYDRHTDTRTQVLSDRHRHTQTNIAHGWKRTGTQWLTNTHSLPLNKQATIDKTPFEVCICNVFCLSCCLFKKRCLINIWLWGLTSLLLCWQG